MRSLAERLKTQNNGEPWVDCADREAEGRTAQDEGESWYEVACHGWEGEAVLLDLYPVAVSLVLTFPVLGTAILAFGLVL